MGDVVGALDCYKRASILSPSNPLCYINAARSYQLLNQLRTSGIHLQAALAMDPSLAMVRVDLSQNLLLAGNAKQALVLLDEALRLSKQVAISVSRSQMQSVSGCLMYLCSLQPIYLSVYLSLFFPFNPHPSIHSSIHLFYLSL